MTVGKWFLSMVLGAMGVAAGSATAAESDDNWAAVNISLPPGFASTVFHPGAGATRHIAVRDNGDVYVARQYLLDVPMFGQVATYGSLLAMRDTDGDGVADVVAEFGPTDVTTEVKIHGGHLYFSSDTVVYRIPLDESLVALP